MALAELPLLVVGDNWDRLGERLRAHGRSRVRFRRALGTPEIYRLLARTKIALNDCTPHHGSHERVMRAAAAGALAVTNRTGWFAGTAAKSGLETLDFERDDIAGRIAALLNDPVTTAARAQAGSAWFRADHTWSRRAATLDAWIADLRANNKPPEAP